MDVYDDFFLGQNVTEPVAIEIPVKLANIHALNKFLQRVGFDTTTNGNETNKLLIDTYENSGDYTYAIITPALKPEDRHAFYATLKQALDDYIKWRKEEFNENRNEIMYPHLLDLNNLVAKKTNIKREKTDEISRIFSDMERSGEATEINIRSSGEYIETLQQIFPKGSVVNGSCMPEPFTIATGFNTRFVRYASTHLGYAMSYASVGTKKELNGYQNITPDGTRTVGFLFQYQPLPDGKQLYFDNAGIERKHNQTSPTESYNETAVNRFDNPCIGEYIMWASVNDPNHRYICKMSPDDERFKKIKEYYQPANPSLNNAHYTRFTTWNQEGDTHKTHMPVKDGNLAQIKANTDAFLQERQEQNNRVEEIKQKLTQMSKQLDKIDTSTPIQAPPYSDTELNKYIQYSQSLDKTKEQYQAYLSDIKNIITELDALKAEIEANPFLQKHEWPIGSVQQAASNKQTSVTRPLSIIDSYQNTCRSNLTKAANTILDSATTFPSKTYENMPAQFRIQLLKGFLARTTKYEAARNKNIIATNIVRLYTFAPDAEKKDVFDLLYQIRKTAGSAFRKELQSQANQISNSNAAEKEALIELFKSDNIFVKHTERAKRKIEFALAQAQLQQQIPNTHNNTQQKAGAEM